MNARNSTSAINRSDLIDMIVASLQDVLEAADAEAPTTTELGEGTRLIGREGMLDSMGLVNLIVDVEQRLEEELDIVVVLADERAMSQKQSPFRSVGSLTDYICQLIEKES